MRSLSRIVAALTVVVGAGAGLSPAAAQPSPDLPPAPSSPTAEKDVGPNLFGGLRSGLEFLTTRMRAEAGLLPAPIPAEASGELVVVPATAVPDGAAPALPGPAGLPADDSSDAVPDDAVSDDATDETLTVRVQVEDGLPVDGAVFAQYVLRTLTDERGWGHDGAVAFTRHDEVTDDDAPDITVALASPSLTDELCAPLRTLGHYSCAMGDLAVLNAERWSAGAEPFRAGGGSAHAYRQYLVNHEVGHVLGHGHTTCPAPGGPAPVMLQQTMRLEGCTPNGWPAQDPS